MNQIPIDDIFRFRCTCCGDCCTGPMEININLFDLYKLAVRLKLRSSEELFKRGLVRLVRVQNEAWTPQILFRREPFAFCPWLINDMDDEGRMKGFCSLHPHDKPLICKMAPAGRVVDLERGEVSYVLTPPTENCPGMAGDEINRLDELSESLKEELDFEYRFYRILDSMAERTGLSEDDYHSLYYFDSSGDFKDIMKERERAFGIEQD